MKTYLTPEQFANLVLVRFNKQVTLTTNPSTGDTILNMLFLYYPEQARGVMMGALWNVDRLEDSVELINVVGPAVHKTFRQTDVIDSPTIDMTIWYCLRDAEIFWRALERACKIMTSEDAAALALEGDL